MADNTKTWLQDPSLLPKVAKRLEADHASRQAESKTYLRCYWDRQVVTVDYTRPYRERALFEKLRESYGGNLTREVVDAAVSILCRQLSPKVMPKGAEFELEQGCKQATRLIEGVYDNADFLGLAKQAIRDGATADIGPCKGYVDPYSEEIRFERINPLELYWVDNGTDTPRTVVHIAAVDRHELMDRYPKHRAAIRDMGKWVSPTVIGVDLPASNRNADTVKFVEAWSTKIGDANGKHALCVGDIVLEAEDWEHEITPVFRFKWSDDFRGYGGVSLARLVSRYDSANRRLLRMVYAGLSGAVPQLLEHEDSETEGPSDVEFGRWKWDGAVKPELVMPQTVSPEVIDRIEKNYARAYAEGGVNQNMATGSAPARYTSGAAQREFVDIANTRLLDAQQQVEKFWKDGARVVVMLAQQARKVHVRVKGANYYEAVSFPRLSRDKYKVTFGLASGLSLTPSGRKQDLQDLKDMGVIDVPEVARSLNLPDIQEIADRLNAPRDLIMQQISICLDHGPAKPFPMPSAMMDLNAAVTIAGQKYQEALLRGTYPPENVEQLRRWIQACRERLGPPPAAPAPMMPAAAGPIMAGPGSPLGTAGPPAVPGPGPATFPPPAAVPVAA